MRVTIQYNTVTTTSQTWRAEYDLPSGVELPKDLSELPFASGAVLVSEEELEDQYSESGPSDQDYVLVSQVDLESGQAPELPGN